MSGSSSTTRMRFVIAGLRRGVRRPAACGRGRGCGSGPARGGAPAATSRRAPTRRVPPAAAALAGRLRRATGTTRIGRSRCREPPAPFSARSDASTRWAGEDRAPPADRTRRGERRRDSSRCGAASVPPGSAATRSAPLGSYARERIYALLDRQGRSRSCWAAVTGSVHSASGALCYRMLLTVMALAGLSAAADSTLLRLLAINDFHGALESRVYGWSGGRPIGGAPALKAILDSAAARCHCATLRLDAGDEMQGTLASNLV